MVHASAAAKMLLNHAPWSRADRLSEQCNYVVRRIRSELRTLTCPIPARVSRRERDLIITGVALAASASGLLILTRIAQQPVPSRLDLAATRLLQRRHSRYVTRGMELISAPGFAPLQHALTLGTAIDFWAFGHRREALFTMMTMGAGAITGVIKVAVNRPRPDPSFRRSAFQFRDKSFPSGHCAHYAAFYGYLFYLTNRCMSPSALRTALLATCIGLIVLVAPSRVYLGHHWTSDVVAGHLVGFTFVFGLIEAYETIGVCTTDLPTSDRLA